MKRLAIIILAFAQCGCIVHVGWIGFPFGRHHHHRPPHPCEPYPQCHIDDSGMGNPDYEPH